MKLTFFEAWDNVRDLYISYRTASITYRGKTISSTFNWGDFDILKRYPKEEGAPTTRAARKEYRDSYCWICEQIVRNCKQND